MFYFFPSTIVLPQEPKATWICKIKNFKPIKKKNKKNKKVKSK